MASRRKVSCINKRGGDHEAHERISHIGGINADGAVVFNGTITVSQATTGAGSALLGANCPASTVSAPFTWVEVILAGATLYVPAWK